MNEQRPARATAAHIDLAALANNLGVVRAALDRAGNRSAIIATVKADAYGHGAVRSAQTLVEAGADALGVALVDEGAELRTHGISGRIIQYGGAFSMRHDLVVQNRLEPFVFRREDLEALDTAARTAGTQVDVHVKVDTGMGRIGLLPEDVSAFFDALAGFSALRMVGLCSHFANADLKDGAMTQAQEDRLAAVAALARSRGFNPTVHLANSAAILLRPTAHLDAVRPGIMLYGVVPARHLAQHGADLRPVLSWTTEIIHVKQVGTGTPISYGSRWIAERPSVIATLPVGYADGYARNLFGHARVLVRGQRAPVVGTICMDMCMIDVTDISAAAVGDEVVLLGAQGSERIDAEQLAEWSGTISYEVLCRIGKRVPRR